MTLPDIATATSANGVDNLKTRIIPALDVTGGRVVKGVEFVNLRDAGDPVELAAFYNAEGADEIVFLDITASADGRETMVDIVRRTADEVFIPMTVGGGIRSVSDMRTMLSSGADKIFINTAALERPELISEGADVFGIQCITVAIDARWSPENNRWDVYSHGGRRNTGRDLVGWAAEAEKRGAGELLVTSMNHDGTGNGYDLKQLEALSSTVNIPIIASGGAGKLAHFADALRPGRADAVLAATLFHFGKLRISQVKEYLREQGIPVRAIGDAT
jgi:cyclase